MLMAFNLRKHDALKLCPVTCKLCCTKKYMIIRGNVLVWIQKSHFKAFKSLRIQLQTESHLVFMIVFIFTSS